jgi:hypothetical protein
MSDPDDLSPADYRAARRYCLLRGAATAGATLAGTSLLSAQARTTRSRRAERPAHAASDAAAMVTGAEYEVTGGDSAKDV